jgi:hypothetical protein
MPVRHDTSVPVQAQWGFGGTDSPACVSQRSRGFGRVWMCRFATVLRRLRRESVIGYDMFNL